jgi:hypothetical protein
MNIAVSVTTYVSMSIAMLLVWQNCMITEGFHPRIREIVLTSYSNFCPKILETLTR